MYDSLKITPKTRGYQVIFSHTNFHLYHYAGNNPINYTDPDGRSPLSAFISKGASKYVIQKAPALAVTLANHLNKVESDPRSLYNQQFKSMREHGNDICLAADVVSLFCLPPGYDFVVSLVSALAKDSGSDKIIWNAKDAADFLKGARRELFTVNAFMETLDKDDPFYLFLANQKDYLENEILLNEAYWYSPDRYYETASGVLGLCKPAVIFCDAATYQKNLIDSNGSGYNKPIIKYKQAYEESLKKKAKELSEAQGKNSE